MPESTHDHDHGRPTSRFRRAGLWLLGAIGVCALLVAAWRCSGSTRTTDGEQLAATATSGEPGGEGNDALPTGIRGRVLLENDQGTRSVGDGIASTSAGEPAHASVPTRAPEPGSCVVRAWQTGQVRAGPVSCDGQGEFELRLPAEVTGTVAVEMLVPGYLRAMIDTEVVPARIGRLPDVALGRGWIVGGQVIDRRGIAVPGVELRARPLPDLGEAEPWRTTSDAQGAFAFDTLPMGPVVLEARAPGFADTVLEVLSPETEVRIGLDRMYTPRGTVVGPPEVLARTQVRLEGSGVWPPLQAQVDGDGRFAFDAVPEGVYAIEAVAAATAPGQAEYASMSLEGVAPAAELTLALIVAFRVPVRVVDGSGHPVAGAAVKLASAQVGLLAHAATTDTEGQAALGPVVGGSYSVRAEAEGYLPTDPVLVQGSQTAPEPVTLVLARPGRIEGIVVDESGQPVAQAQVQVDSDGVYSYGATQMSAAVAAGSLRPTGSLGVSSGPVPPIPLEAPMWDPGQGPTSDAQGRFVLGDLTPGVYRLSARHEGRGEGDETLVRVGAGATVTGVRLVLGRGVPLTGRVRDDNGQPVVGARIELDDGSQVWSDGRGLFAAGLRRGDITLVVAAPGLAAQRRQVHLGTEPVDLEFTLTRANGVVIGQVVNDNHRPEPGIPIWLYSDHAGTPSESTVTDERGQFRFVDLPLGRGALEIDDGIHGRIQRGVDVVQAGRERPIELVLRAGWHLEVEVIDGETGRPVPGATLRAPGLRARTDAGGRARLGPVSAPALELVTEAPGYGPVQTTVQRGQSGVTQVQIPLTEGGTLRGVVTDWRGDPVAGATVVATDSGGHEHPVTCDGRGRFHLEGLQPGDVQLLARPPTDRREDLGDARERFDVLRGRVTEGVDLRLPRG